MRQSLGSLRSLRPFGPLRSLGSLGSLSPFGSLRALAISSKLKAQRGLIRNGCLAQTPEYNLFPRTQIFKPIFHVMGSQREV